MGGAGAQQLDPGYQGFATGLPAGRGPVPLGNGTEGVAQTGGGKRCPWSWWTGAHEPPQPPAHFPSMGSQSPELPVMSPTPRGQLAHSAHSAWWQPHLRGCSAAALPGAYRIILHSKLRIIPGDKCFIFSIIHTRKLSHRGLGQVHKVTQLGSSRAGVQVPV